MKITFKTEDLKQFSGSEVFYRHSLNRKLVYTEGVQYLAENAKCYWLIDEIAFVLYPVLLKKHLDYFYSIEFMVRSDNTAIIKVGDGNGKTHITHKINYTNFPVTEEPVNFYLCESEKHYCLMLSGEY